MVETGHISHNGFLIRTSSVHNVYEVGGDRGYEDKHLHFGKPGHAAQVKLKHSLQTSRQTFIYNRLLDSHRQLMQYKNNTE